VSKAQHPHGNANLHNKLLLLISSAQSGGDLTLPRADSPFMADYLSPHRRCLPCLNVDAYMNRITPSVFGHMGGVCAWVVLCSIDLRSRCTNTPNISILPLVSLFLRECHARSIEALRSCQLRNYVGGARSSTTACRGALEMQIFALCLPCHPAGLSSLALQCESVVHLRFPRDLTTAEC